VAGPGGPGAPRSSGSRAPSEAGDAPERASPEQSRHGAEASESRVPWSDVQELASSSAASFEARMARLPVKPAVPLRSAGSAASTDSTSPRPRVWGAVPAGAQANEAPAMQE
jgi:hypothetical protein